MGRDHVLWRRHVADRWSRHRQGRRTVCASSALPGGGGGFGRLETFSREVRGRCGRLEAAGRCPRRIAVKRRRARGHGVELYAPVHVIVTLSARVTGPVDGVVQVRAG
jgi:hypothetical protein